MYFLKCFNPLTGEHYTYFFIHEAAVVGPSTLVNRKYMFLTYLGIVKFIFSSRNMNADRFQKWAITLLFAHQMGTPEQRVVAGASLTGRSVEDVRNFLELSANDMEVIYLFSLGTVGELRNVPGMTFTGGVRDDDVVYKFGRSKDLRRRMNEHVRKYQGISLSLVKVAYINDNYLVEAEGQLREFVDTHELRGRIKFFVNNEEQTELMVANAAEQNWMRREFKSIADTFGSKLREAIALRQQVESELAGAKRELAGAKREIALLERLVQLRDGTAVLSAQVPAVQAAPVTPQVQVIARRTYARAAVVQNVPQWAFCLHNNHPMCRTCQHHNKWKKPCLEKPETQVRRRRNVA